MQFWLQRQAFHGMKQALPRCTVTILPAAVQAMVRGMVKTRHLLARSDMVVN